MKLHWNYFLFVIPATLLISTSARAEEVSTKAVDLAASVSSDQNTNQQTASTEEKQYPFVIAQNANEIDENTTEMNYWYVSGSVGLHFPSDFTGSYLLGRKGSVGLDDGFQGSAAVGYQWSQARAELEFAYFNYGINSVKPAGGSSIPTGGEGNLMSLLLNGYWDFPTDSKLRPYVGGGIGVAFPDLSINSGVSSALALQAKTGVQYQVTKKGNVFLEAKYQYTGAHSAGSGANKADYDSSGTFGLGVGYRQGF